MAGLAYVVFPGNVGGPDDLARVAATMAGTSDTSQHSGHVRGKPTVSEVLKEAREAGRAVGAFNVYNIEGALAVADAVQTTGLPAMLQIHPVRAAYSHPLDFRPLF